MPQTLLFPYLLSGILLTGRSNMSGRSGSGALGVGCFFEADFLRFILPVGALA